MAIHKHKIGEAIVQITRDRISRRLMECAEPVSAIGTQAIVIEHIPITRPGPHVFFCKEKHFAVRACDSSEILGPVPAGRAAAAFRIAQKGVHTVTIHQVNGNGRIMRGVPICVGIGQYRKGWTL